MQRISEIFFVLLFDLHVFRAQRLIDYFFLLQPPFAPQPSFDACSSAVRSSCGPFLPTPPDLLLSLLRTRFVVHNPSPDHLEVPSKDFGLLFDLHVFRAQKFLDYFFLLPPPFATRNPSPDHFEVPSKDFGLTVLVTKQHQRGKRGGSMITLPRSTMEPHRRAEEEAVAFHTGFKKTTEQNFTQLRNVVMTISRCSTSAASPASEGGLSQLSQTFLRAPSWCLFLATVGEVSSSQHPSRCALTFRSS